MARKRKTIPAPPLDYQARALELLLPYQQRWVNDAARYKIGVWSRQTGKSFTTAAESVLDALSDPGTKWVCMSAGERQALEWLEKAKEWAQVLKEAFEEVPEKRDGAEAVLRRAEIRFRNGSRILAIPANPKTARGWSSNVILDEFAYHEKPPRSGRRCFRRRRIRWREPSGRGRRR